jgi:hypothetical protein
MARRLVALLALLMMLADPVLGREDFVVETVDRGEGIGGFVSIDIDDTGKIWIAYGGGSERFAFGRAGNWTRESSGRGLACAPRSSVSLDADGSPGIVCFTTYYHKLGAAWEFEGFGYDRPGFHIGFDHSDALATGTNGSIFAAVIQTYVIHHGYPGEGTYHTLMVAERTPQGWTWVDLDGPAFTPAAPLKIDMVADPTGDPHVGVVPSRNETFRYYHRTGQVWSWEYVSGITADFAIAITSDGTPVVAYANDSGLWWAQEDETWDRTRIVDSAFISAPDVVLDQNNVPHVKYQTETQVRYATIDANGTWQTCGVDSTSATSGGIAVDAGGVPHIAYYDPESQKLRYATWQNATPVRATSWSSVKSRFRR